MLGQRHTPGPLPTGGLPVRRGRCGAPPRRFIDIGHLDSSLLRERTWPTQTSTITVWPKPRAGPQSGSMSGCQQRIGSQCGVLVVAGQDVRVDLQGDTDVGVAGALRHDSFTGTPLASAAVA